MRVSAIGREHANFNTSHPTGVSAMGRVYANFNTFYPTGVSAMGTHVWFNPEQRQS